MKGNFKVLMKRAAALLLALALVSAFGGAVFAQGQEAGISLADSLRLGPQETVEVIVEFTAPSLLETKTRAGTSAGASREKRLLSGQEDILERLGIVPRHSYTGILNAAAVTVTDRQLRQLERTRGVKAVYLCQSFTAPEIGQYRENAVSMSEMMGISPSLPGGDTGDGVLVAVLDSGITAEHEAFQNTKYVKNPKLTAETVAQLGYSDPAGYYNGKIPFYCDYTGSNAPFEDVSGHGSHVAGIIGGYVEEADGAVRFSGIAPGAQLCAMRVLNEFGGGNDGMIIAALEDAYRLGADIINISFGRDAAFRLGGEQYLAYDGIFERLEAAGVMVVCSAGNLGSMAENTPRHVLDENCVDYGTLSLPAIYPGNTGVGSVGNTRLYTPVIHIQGQDYRYSDPMEQGDPLNFSTAFNGRTVEIAYFHNYGKAEDYAGVEVTGKVVAVKRGELSFTDKCSYAAAAGAIGLIVISGENDTFGGMVINEQSIPAIMVEYGAGQHFPMTEYVVTLGNGMLPVADGGKLSYFSAVGVTPDLEIGLDILGIGGSVPSVKAGTADEYVVYSGTSMAAPTVAGIYALLYQRLRDAGAYEEATPAAVAHYMEAVTQSTAKLLTDDLGNQYSPRFQGAGFIDLEKATRAKAYLTAPLVCLGYDKTGSGSLSVEYELVSSSREDVSYRATVSAITDSFRQITPTDYKNNVTPQMLDSGAYTYTVYVADAPLAAGEAFTLPAGEKRTVRVELALSGQAASVLSAAFPYGYFLDGFVEFRDVTAPEETALHGGYVSFVGDWLAGPALEPLTQIDVMEWINSIGADIQEMLPYFAAGHINANYNYTTLLLGENRNYLGQNPLDPERYIPAYPDRNAMSADCPEADLVLYDTLYLSPSLLRSCKEITYVVTNSETGEVYASQTQKDVRKDIYYGNYQHFALSEFVFDPVDGVTGQIPSGTELTVSVYTLLDHPDATKRLEATYQLTVDNTAPVLRYVYDANTQMLTVEATDSAYLAGILLETADPEGETERRIYAEQTPGMTHREVFDLSDRSSDSVRIITADYAGNVVTEVLSLEESVSNIESAVTGDAALSVTFAKTPCLLQATTFTVAPAEGYCFTDAFAIFVNETALTPVSVENGVYTYSITPNEETLTITAQGAAPHSFVPAITGEAGCVSDGERTYLCENCGCVGSREPIPATGHTAGAAEILTNATCTEPGATGVSCVKCGARLSTQPIPALGHTQGARVNAKEATCFAEGNTGDSKCAVCGVLLETGQKLEKLPHTFDNACDETCNTPGCGHTRSITHTPNPEDGDCTTAITCSVCGAVITPGTDHTYDNACDGDCNNCGKQRSVEHTYDDPKDGSCNICGAQREIPRDTGSLLLVIALGLATCGIAAAVYWLLRKKKA